MEWAGIMEHINITVADVVQVIILLVAVVTFINSYGSRIKALEKDIQAQVTRCNGAMREYVPRQLLNSKIETLTKELEHLNAGQTALSKKMDEMYKVILDFAQKR